MIRKRNIKYIEIITWVGFVVLRIVTDNRKANVLQPIVKNSGGKDLPLFLSFDYNKKPEQYILEREICSKDDIITSDSFKTLYNLQIILTVKLLCAY